jgi:hypothetical protein
MNKTKTLLDGLVAVAIVGAVIGIGVGSLAVVAIWIVRALT